MAAPMKLCRACFSSSRKFLFGPRISAVGTRNFASKDTAPQSEDETHFGFENVSKAEKTERGKMMTETYGQVGQSPPSLAVWSFSGGGGGGGGRWAWADTCILMAAEVATSSKFHTCYYILVM